MKLKVKDPKIVKWVLIGAIALVVAGVGGTYALKAWYHSAYPYSAEMLDPAVLAAELDSSSVWVAQVGGACARGKGICCSAGLASHFKDVKNVAKSEIDESTGAVLLTIKEGKTVTVAEIQEALGKHWMIKSTERVTG